MALAITLLLGFSAFAVDFGRAFYEKQKLQAAIDNASIAAAKDLPDKVKATATVKQYMILNGYSESEIKSPPAFSNSDMRIDITGTKDVDYTLAKVIGFNKGTVDVGAAAEKQGVGGEAFNYAVFAGGGEVSFNGSKHVFDGGVYGRDGVSLGNKAEIPHGNAVSSNGNCDTFTGPGKSIINNPVIPMPDFSALMKAQGIAIASQAEFDTKVKGKTINGPIYVNGDLTINGTIKGKGIIYATGDISYEGDQTPSDSICVYSGGDITFNGGTGNVYGIMYAPNGTITINGAPNGEVYGRIVAKAVRANGAKFSIYSNPSDLDGLNTLQTVKLVK